MIMVLVGSTGAIRSTELYCVRYSYSHFNEDIYRIFSLRIKSIAESGEVLTPSCCGFTSRSIIGRLVTESVKRAIHPSMNSDGCTSQCHVTYLDALGSEGRRGVLKKKKKRKKNQNENQNKGCD